MESSGIMAILGSQRSMKETKSRREDEIGDNSLQLYLGL